MKRATGRTKVTMIGAKNKRAAPKAAAKKPARMYRTNLRDVPKVGGLKRRDGWVDMQVQFLIEHHGAIVTASGNSLLPELMNSLIHVPVVSHTYRLYSPARMRQSMRQHRELLDAVTAGDGAYALKGLEEGQYTLTVAKPGNGSGLG